MGRFVINGTAEQRGADKIDPRLIDIMRAAAATSPYDVELFSGKRSDKGSRHGHGKAIDIVLRDPKTNAKIPNLGAGGNSFDAYQNFSFRARDAQQNRYPELGKSFRWGGFFGPSQKNPSGADLMYFDIKPGGAMAMGSWESGLNKRGGRFIASKGAGKTYSETGRVTGTMPETVLTGLINPTPPNREKGIDGNTLDVMARTILGEAEGEGYAGQVAVSNILNNRKNSPRYDDNIIDVALAPGQFSTHNSGEGGRNTSKFKQGGALYDQARAIAADTLSGRLKDPTLNATSYYALNAMKDKKEPYWANEENKHGTKQIGNHTFLVGNKPATHSLAKPAAPKTALAAIETIAPSQEKPKALAYTGPKKVPTRPNPRPSFEDQVREVASDLPIMQKYRLGQTVKHADATKERFADLGQSITSPVTGFANDLGGMISGLFANSGNEPTQTASSPQVSLPRPRPQAPRPKSQQSYGPAGMASAPQTPRRTGGSSQAQIPLTLPKSSPANLPLNTVRPTTNPRAVRQPNFLTPIPKVPTPRLQDQKLNPFQQVQSNVRRVTAPVRNVRHGIAGQVDGLKLAVMRMAQQQGQRAAGNRPSHTISLDRAASNGNIVGRNGYIYRGTPGNYRQVGKVDRDKAKMHSNRTEKPKGYRYMDGATGEWKTK